MKEYIKYIPLGIFVAFCSKALVIGASLTEAPALAIVALFSAYLVHRDEEKQLKSIMERLSALEKQGEDKTKEVEELRSHVSTLKLGQQMRSAVKF